METVRQQCPAEQHEHILRTNSARCFCPYCGLELRGVCSPKAHEQRMISGDLFCITCGTALTAESTARKELEKLEAKKRCAENSHKGVTLARVLENGKFGCFLCDAELDDMNYFSATQ